MRSLKVMDNDGVLPSNSEKRFFPLSLFTLGHEVLKILDIQILGITMPHSATTFFKK